MHFSRISFSVLLVVPTAYAILSLDELQSLNKDEVTLGCLNTYNREIKECAQETIGVACSSDCEKALTTLSKDVILACRQAYAGPDTLLRKILDGGLVTTLCPKLRGQTSSTSATTKDDAPKTSSAPEETSTVTSGTGQPTSSPTSKSTNATSTKSPSQTTLSGATKTPGSDDTILGNNAAGKVAVGMGVILGAVVAGVVSMF